ncbi:MAG: hypothetical protein ACPGXK_16265, partial [Phycisphaerae bacterium]
SGMMSENVGVSENSSTPVGMSLQLVGSGNSRQDFIWQSTGPNTRGVANNAQTFDACVEKPVSVPATSHWGLICLALLVVTVASAVYGRSCFSD